MGHKEIGFENVAFALFARGEGVVRRGGVGVCFIHSNQAVAFIKSALFPMN